MATDANGPTTGGGDGGRGGGGVTGSNPAATLQREPLALDQPQRGPAAWHTCTSFFDTNCCVAHTLGFAGMVEPMVQFGIDVSA